MWPLLRPDIFTGARRPPRGILLFGPPGTGKTMLAKSIATAWEGATFISASASTIMSKYVGEAEKNVKALFQVARAAQPAIVFLDEIEGLLSTRTEKSNDSGTGKVKTEFLIEMNNLEQEQCSILFIGATNRPQDIDEAVRRRMPKRLYVPLPDLHAREQLIRNVLNSKPPIKHTLTDEDVLNVAKDMHLYSGADIRQVVTYAANAPFRALPREQFLTIKKSSIRPLTKEDFVDALRANKPSVSREDVEEHIKFDKQFGSKN